MAILNKTGITSGGTIQAEHVTRTIDALTGASTDTIIATGSFTGSFTGPLTGTASFATSASRSVSSSFAATASYALNAIGSGTEYMTLRLSSGDITSISSGSAIYIGVDRTNPAAGRIGIMLPYDCTIVSASVYLNNRILIGAALRTINLNYNVTTTPVVQGSFADLDPNSLYVDGNSIPIGYDAAGYRWINVSFVPSAAVATSSFTVSADILIKKK
jgi:hypothetical protein